MKKLPEELIKSLSLPDTVKFLTTTDQEGRTHTVFKGTLTVLDKGYLAYVELIESSQTYRNMLWNYYWKRDVGVIIFNPTRGISYQIKGKPYKWLTQGPIWDELLEQLWIDMPETNPSGVWLITPEEVIDQRYEARVEEKEKERPGFWFWRKYIGKRPEGKRV